MLIAVIVLAVSQAISIYFLWSQHKVMWHLLGELHKVQDRIREAGLNLGTQASTQVRVPEKWVDYDGQPDEEIQRTDVHISKQNEWLELQ